MKPKPAAIDSLKAQLAQVDQLIADGTLKGAAAKSARETLEAQVLAEVMGKGAAQAHAAGATPPAPRAPRRLVLGVAGFVVVFAAAGYAWLGNRAGWSVGPGETGEAVAQGASHSTDEAEMTALIDRLAERLKAQPDDADGWTMLARSYASRGRHEEALKAYKKALDLRPKDAQTIADYADGLAMVNNRSLDGEPEKLVLQAVKIDPRNVKALALAGTAAFNHGDYKAAVDFWDRAIQASPAGGDFARQLQGALAEARQRAGMPPLAAAAAAAPPESVAAAAPEAPAPAGGAQPAAAGGGAITGRVTLKDSFKGQVSPEDTLFVFARPATGSKMPLAILRKKVGDLPLDFRLDDSQALNPAMRLSTVEQVVVGARISKSGNAVPSPGDLQALSAPVAVGAQGLRIEIAEAVR